MSPCVLSAHVPQENSLSTAQEFCIVVPQQQDNSEREILRHYSLPSAGQFRREIPHHPIITAGQFRREISRHHSIITAGQFSREIPHHPIITAGQFRREIPRHHSIITAGQFSREIPHHPIITAAQFRREIPRHHSIITAGQFRREIPRHHSIITAGQFRREILRHNSIPTVGIQFSDIIQYQPLDIFAEIFSDNTTRWTIQHAIKWPKASLYRLPLLFFQVAPQLYSRSWVDPVPDPLLLRKFGSAGNPVPFFVIERTGTAFRHLFSTGFQSFNPMSDKTLEFTI
jgi:hypothetical protein